ncbi:MAG TPA: PLP-dependent aminotransferase family protein [Allosphingosinicella sp.]|jgi:GntR family transcriptional regulator/MocR family aminotransferase
MSVDRAAPQSLHVQLYTLIKRNIEIGRIPPGSPLPSSRSFAAELGLARATVTVAFEQLAAEGYVTGRRGTRLRVADAYDRPAGNLTPSPLPSAEQREKTPPLLRPGLPDIRLFPNAAWNKAAARCWRSASPGVLGGGDPCGALELRRALAGHLAEWRGIQADPEQILITAGSAGALQLILDTLTQRHDVIATEEPSYQAFRRLADRRGLNVCSLPVGEDGIDIDALRSCPDTLRLCVVTPSHQYPLGHAMPIVRRFALLDWAAEADAVVVEDDYDSEFRYDGRPLPSLMALSHGARVINVGTTSKVLSPALRIGYIVAPPSLIECLRATADDLEQRASTVPQYPLAELIVSGEYARHLRRMRRTYRERRRVLTSLLEERVPCTHLTLQPQAAGLHLVSYLGPALTASSDDVALAAKCREAGLGVLPLSYFYRGATKRQGLLLGFAAFDEGELTEGVSRLAEVLQAT